jgi:hypothetical protein
LFILLFLKKAFGALIKRAVNWLSPRIGHYLQISSLIGIIVRNDSIHNTGDERQDCSSYIASKTVDRKYLWQSNCSSPDGSGNHRAIWFYPHFGWSFRSSLMTHTHCLNYLQTDLGWSFTHCLNYLQTDLGWSFTHCLNYLQTDSIHISVGPLLIV